MMPWITGVLTICTCVLAVSTSVEAMPARAAELPPHPRLLLNSEGIAALKQRIKHCDWAAKRWKAMKAEADRLLAEPVELPPRGGNWTHWYACPEHGAPLKKGKQIGAWQWEHICSVGGEKLTSDITKASTDYDGCVINGIHNDLARSIRNLGLVYQLTGDVRYAKKARDILLAYAGKYLDYPLHNVHGEPKLGGGRQGPQTLDEAVWLIPLCQGADLIWNTLSESDKKTIAEKLLLPAVKEVIMPHRIGIHNIQCWKNSAVGLVGLLLGDQELIREAIYDADMGYAAQMKKGVMPDGGWWEGAWGYHFYTLSALWSLTEAAHNCGINLYGEKLKSMFDAPLKFAAPDLTLPAFNDSSTVDLKTSASIYELAYTRFRDPSYLTPISQGERVSDFAFWFGQEELPSTLPRKWKSENYPQSGYAILARGEGENATWLCFKYGPHGGGHGHPDKLSFVLYARGRTIGIDPGSVRYGLPIHSGWYRQSVAHNTLVVDQSSQKPAEGKCLEFGTTNGIDFVSAEAGDIYDGIRFTRKIAMPNENLIVVTDRVECNEEHTLDIVYHQRGVWENLPAGSDWNVPDIPGYKYLKDATTRTTSNEVVLKAIVPDIGPVAITLAGGEQTEVITATGVGANISDRVPVVIFRRKAKETTFTWAISLDGKPVDLQYLRDSTRL